MHKYISDVKMTKNSDTHVFLRKRKYENNNDIMEMMKNSDTHVFLMKNKL